MGLGENLHLKLMYLLEHIMAGTIAIMYTWVYHSELRGQVSLHSERVEDMM